jgi:hypothetical protein
VSRVEKFRRLKENVKEMEYEDADWIHMAQDRDHRPATVKT